MKKKYLDGQKHQTMEKKDFKIHKYLPITLLIIKKSSDWKVKLLTLLSVLVQFVIKYLMAEKIFQSLRIPNKKHKKRKELVKMHNLFKQEARIILLAFYHQMMNMILMNHQLLILVKAMPILLNLNRNKINIKNMDHLLKI